MPIRFIPNHKEQSFEPDHDNKTAVAVGLFNDGNINIEDAAYLAGLGPQEMEREIKKTKALERKTIMVAGGAGFMGSNFIKYIFNNYPNYQIVNYDKITYAGNLENLKDIATEERYKFIKADIADKHALEEAIEKEKPNIIVNFAAETHVDRSIADADAFVKTNIHGVHTLLEAATKYNLRLVQISTDEVFGSIKEGKFNEHSPYRANSPYSAAKAAGDMLCRSYYKTHKTDVVVTHSCNCFGPRQFPEKLIPLFTTNLIDGEKVPVYGTGQNVREWIHADDHSRAVDFIIKKAKAGDVFNIGTGEEYTNLKITELMLEKFGKSKDNIEYVTDRKGHDFRYAIDCTKLRNLGWKPLKNFEQALEETIDWYKNNQWWWRPLKTKHKAYVGGQKHEQMKALITAGGRGTRLRPITFTRNKHIIPLANRPMIEYAIKKIAEGGIKEIGISINENENDIPDALGDGSNYGVNITYIEQKGGPLGLAHVVKNAREFLGDSPFLFYLGDNLIFSDLNKFIGEFKEKNLNCFLALSQVPDPQRFGVPVIENGQIKKVLEKPAHPPSDYAVTGIYLYDSSIHDAVASLEPSARGEYEISDAHTYLIENGFNVGWQEITGWWKDTGKPGDLLEGNRLLLEQIKPDTRTTNIDKSATIQGNVDIAEGAEIKGSSFIRGPVVIGREAKIINSYIGPYTSVGHEAHIENTEIEHSLVMDRAKINTRRKIIDSIIGYDARIEGSDDKSPSGNRIIAGDNSNLQI